MSPRAPRHHQATTYARSGLFKGLSAFSELERRIEQLPTEQERGDAFEVFVEAHLNTDETAQADEVWVTANVPPEIRHALKPSGCPPATVYVLARVLTAHAYARSETRIA